jgi:hypothetical protein
MKGEIVKFPLGSSEDMPDNLAHVLTEVVRQAIDHVVVVGIDVEGDLVVIHDPDMTSERVHFLLTKACRRLDEEPIELEIEIDEEEADIEDEQN